MLITCSPFSPMPSPNRPSAATEAEAFLPLASVSEFGPLLAETPLQGAPWFGFHVSTCDGLRFELATSSKVKVRGSFKAPKTQSEGVGVF